MTDGSTGSVPAGEYWGTGGAPLLYTDARMALMLLNRGRRNLIMRTFGVSADQVDLVSLIAVGIFIKAIHEKTSSTLAAAPGIPGLGDAALITGVTDDVVHWVAGEWSQDMPLLTPLLMFVAVATVLRPVARLSFRDVRALAHQARVGFDHRYGHLIRRNLPRRARAAGPGPAPAGSLTS